MTTALSAEVIYGYRADLLRYARMQLRSEALAEDVTSQALLAALEQAANFRGASAPKTWLIGILKFKILDVFREQKREPNWSDVQPGGSADEEGNGEAAIEQALFDASGHFAAASADWHDPEGALSRQEFFAVLEACLEQLPPEQGRVFMMREWLELDADAVCKELAISSTNLYVLMHRAKLRLRECMAQRWFAKD